MGRSIAKVQRTFYVTKYPGDTNFLHYVTVSDQLWSIVGLVERVKLALSHQL